MPADSPDTSGPTQKGAGFGVTSWTLIYAARDSDLPQRREALEQLCRTYWYPLYAYARRHDHSPEDAADLTQSFFHHLLERNFLGAVDRRKGKFRSFLLVSLRYFLENQRQFQQAAKRGGGQHLLSLDECMEDRFSGEPTTKQAPELLFDRDWATALLQQVRARLQDEYRQLGKTGLFENICRFLTEQGNLNDYQTIAAQSDLSGNAVAIAVHRLRQRYRDTLRQEIQRTAGPDDAEREMQHLLEVIGNLDSS